MKKAITQYELKRLVESSGNERYFFTRETMRFFGDTMRNYGIRDGGNVWELYRRKPVKHKRKDSTYFDKTTLKRVFI